MPLYDFRCECGDTFERIARYDEAVTCKCGKTAERLISSPYINAAFLGSSKNPGYQCVVTGEWVDTKRRRMEIMREHNLVEKG